MRTKTPAKPCKIIVTTFGPRGDHRESIATGERHGGQAIVYRSVRHARACLLVDAGACMDYLYSGSYGIHLETLDGRRLPVSDFAEAAVARWIRFDQWYRSIGQCLRRGETVVV